MGKDCGAQLSSGRGAVSLCVWHQEAVVFPLLRLWQLPGFSGQGEMPGEETSHTRIFLSGSILQLWSQGPKGTKSSSAQALNCCGALCLSSPLMMSPASAVALEAGEVRFGQECSPCLPPPQAGAELLWAQLSWWRLCWCRAVFPSQSCISPTLSLVLSQKQLG